MQKPLSNTPHVVYHVAAMGNWKGVVSEQMLMLRTSGLGTALTAINDAVNVTYVGDPNGMEFLRQEAARQDIAIRIVRHDPNVSHYETFAMLEIERLAKEENTARHILYFHTKGVSVPHCQDRVAWRRVMGRYVIEMWRDNVLILNHGQYDAVGWNWWPRGNNHFSGTFWIATADWIRKLQDYVQFHHSHGLVRYSCELWIGSQVNPRCRAYSRGVTDHVTWEGGYNFTPHLPAPKNAITWMTAASYEYAKEFGNVVSSSVRLGRNHKMVTRLIDSSIKRWSQRTTKHELMLSMLDEVKTKRAFWLDGDCEFLCQLDPEDLYDPKKPLSCVQHLGYSSPFEAYGFLDDLRALVPADATGYWQACLWGGEVEAMIEAITRCQQIMSSVGGHAQDEHALNVDIQNHRDLYHTLPCRYAAPYTFASMPQYEGSYNSRAGGSPRIMHFNKEVSR